MKHQHLQLSIVFFFGLVISGLQAQNIYMRKTIDKQTDYALTSIKKMTFSSGNLIVSSAVGADASYALNELRYLNFKDLTLGENQPLQKPQTILVYPNPVSDILHLSLTVLGEPTLLEIISIEGRVMLQKDWNASSQLATIPISGLPQGLYFCKISNANNTQTIKFLKQ